MTIDSALRIFGIRHHGPGSARSLRTALESLQPDCLLVEGPPDADSLLPFAAHAEMKPPVSLLVYAQADASQAAHFPFAIFSPEWQAIQFALRRDLPIRFMDLPQAHRFAVEGAQEVAAEPDGPAGAGAGVPDRSESPETPEAADDQADEPDVIRRDPLDWIARAAGQRDGESWWEQMVEQRRESAGVFGALLEMMRELRAALPPDPDPIEPLREAWMRRTIRAARQEGHRRIAVVCGAWHAPALADGASEADDALLLRGLPRMKVAATWIPWTYGRLCTASGYGAGVRSPAWYEQLWAWPDAAPVRWMTAVAALLRSEDLPASPASVIEAVRLSEALAALRDLPAAGLPELWEAAQSVLCGGGDAPMRLIETRLVVGERLGEVPAETPMLPIQQDLRAEQRRLRLPPEASQSEKDLDLRNQTDLDRSILLHRLNLLDVPWGTLRRSGGGKSTFHEVWALQWRPEFEVRLIEANLYGSTVARAASACAVEVGGRAIGLPDVTALLERALLADLRDVIPDLLSRLESMAAITSDVPHLMEAAPPLAKVVRYGDVRQTDASLVTRVVDGLLTRIYIGLPTACASLNDEAAEEMLGRLVSMQEALRMLDNRDYLDGWTIALERLADVTGLHGLIAGRCARLLLDQGAWDAEEVGRRMRLTVSPAVEPNTAAMWVDGLLRDSGDILLHTDSLWQILDEWTTSLDGQVFDDMLPLLRRTFSTFPAPLRRRLGDRVRGGRRAEHGEEMRLDPERGERTLPTTARLLGLPWPERASVADRLRGPS